MPMFNPEQNEAVDWVRTEHAAAVLADKAKRENLESVTAHNGGAVKLLEAKAQLRHTLGGLAIALGIGWSVFGWVRLR